jgi:hypothetical protein
MHQTMKKQILDAARNPEIIQQAAATAAVDRNSSKYRETQKLMQQSNHFDWKRWDTQLEKFDGNKGKQRGDTIIQRNSGIAIMPILIGKVNFNKKRPSSNKRISKIQDEATLWNVPIDAAECLQKLKEKLLVHQRNGAKRKNDDKWFKPRKLGAYQWDDWT